MLTLRQAPHTVSTTLSSWWRSTLEPVATRVTDFSAENNLALSTGAVGLTTASFFFPPLYLLAAPTILFSVVPAYTKVVQDWQARHGVGEAAIEAALLTILVATDRLMLGAAGAMMLAAGRSGVDDDDEEDNPLTSLALGTLALPVAGLAGVSATLYATIARTSPRHATRQYLRQHDIKVHDWLAARKLPQVEIILLDQSCLVETILKDVHAFHHRLAEEVAWYARKAAPSALQRQLRAIHPDVPHGTSGADVQLLTACQLRLSNLTAQAEADNYLYVVVNQQVIGALEVEKVPIATARQLLIALRQIDRPIILLSDANVAETETLLADFDLKEAHANMGWQQKVEFCREQRAACFVSREVPSAVGLADVAVTLSADDLSSDIALDADSFGMLSLSMEEYAKRRTFRHIFSTAPMVVTIGGVFFLQWGMPAAIAVQGVSAATNRLVDWRLKPRKAHSTPAPTPLAASSALAA